MEVCLKLAKDNYETSKHKDYAKRLLKVSKCHSSIISQRCPNTSKDFQNFLKSLLSIAKDFQSFPTLSGGLKNFQEFPKIFGRPRALFTG